MNKREVVDEWWDKIRGYQKVQKPRNFKVVVSGNNGSPIPVITEEKSENEGVKECKIERIKSKNNMFYTVN